MSAPLLRVISLGAGVQSTTMALMAGRGEIGPMPDCAIFADTQSEPSAVYRHLDWLEKQLPFPVYRVTAGSLREHILGAVVGNNLTNARPPFFTKSGGMLRRQCTQDFKLLPIQKKVRELIGLKRYQRTPKVPVVEQWIGISLDEAGRMKPSRLPYITHRFPLIEKLMSRTDCLAWCEACGFPRPPKSACTFCPFTDRPRWRDMKENDPESFTDACAVDVAIRTGVPGQRNGEEWFIHRDRIPLADVDFDDPVPDARQGNLFINEREGMCGV